MTNLNTAQMTLAELSLKNERIMLVGGAGFIGHHLALGLKKMGAEVLIVDNMQVNNIVKILTSQELVDIKRKLYTNFILERFSLLRENKININNVDSRNLNELSSSFSDFQPTKAIHLAAISSAVDANKVPNLAYDIQINSLRNLLSLCQMKHSKCNHVCFMSSSTVYGDFLKDSVDETMRPNPKGVYANGKYIGERMVREANELYGLDYTIIRPSALYGIRCISGRISQKFIENGLMGYPLVLEGGGNGRLDFTHIDDLVEGIIRAIAIEDALSSTFNITYGNARTILDIANIVKSLLPSVNVKIGPKVLEKPKRGTLITDRAKNIIGFNPKRSIDQYYKKYCKWYINEWNKI